MYVTFWRLNVSSSLYIYVHVVIVDAAAVAAVAAAANKVAFSYTPVSTTRQLTVPQVPPKNQTTSASPYSTQFANPQQTAATSYHYSNPAATQNVNKVSTDCINLVLSFSCYFCCPSFCIL